MKSLTDKIFESLKQKDYGRNWEFFNTMVTNIELTKDEYMKMFDNLSDEEVTEWIKLTKTCYVGSDAQDEADKMQNKADLAAFYAKHSVKE